MLASALCRGEFGTLLGSVGALPALFQFSSPCGEIAEAKHVDVLPRDEITL